MKRSRQFYTKMTRNYWNHPNQFFLLKNSGGNSGEKILKMRQVQLITKN